MILLEEKAKDAFASLVKIKYIFASSGGGAFLIVCVFAFLFARNSNTAISEFTRGSRRVLSGDLEHSITVPHRKDEINELINSFNLMIS